MGKEKKDKIEFDYNELENHLNASFDNDDIEVSEDLIAKTLKAIQEGKSPSIESEDSENSDRELHSIKNKGTKSPFITIASAAAVILILFMGVKMIGPIGSSKGSSPDMNEMASLADTSVTAEKSSGAVSFSDNSSASYDIVANSETSQSYDESAEGNSGEGIQNEDSQTSLALGKATEGNSLDTNGTSDKNNELGTLTDNSNDTTENSLETSDSDGTTTTLTTLQSGEETYSMLGSKESFFSDLFSFSSEEVSSLTLTGSAQKNSISTVKTEEVNELLSTLNEYKLVAGDNDISDIWNYKALLKMKDGQQYTIFFGSGIQVTNDTNPTSADGYYTIDNAEALLEQMKELYSQLMIEE